MQVVAARFSLLLLEMPIVSFCSVLLVALQNVLRTHSCSFTQLDFI